MTGATLDEARERHRRGELPAAIDAYADFLADNPQHADAWHLRALAEHQAGRLEAAWSSVSSAVDAGDAGPPTLLLAGLIARDRGDLAAADDWFTRAAASRPGWGPPLANRGQVLMELGRTGEALEVLRAAGAAEPTNARVWNNMALALMNLDRLDEAKRAFEHSLTLMPLASAHYNLARIHNLRNDIPKAMEQANAAVQRDPALSDAYLLLGDLYRKVRDAEGMRKSFAQAVRANPRNTRARNAYAEFLAGVGDAEGAKTAYRHILAEEPRSLRAALGAALTLPQVYSGVDDVEAWRGKFTEGLAGLEEGGDRFRYPTPREAIEQARWSNFYLAYQGRDDRELQSRYGDFVGGVLRPAFAGLTQALARPPRRDRIRVGFSSHFFFNCTVGRYFSSWITRLDPRRFETYVYYTNDWIADDTRVVASAAAAFRHLPGRSFDLVARHILEDQLDVLVYPELGMHVQSFPLGALRLAPVQVAGWGHPVTTGLPEIDYFVSCEAMEPGDAASQYREKLALLPGLGTHYALPADVGQGSRADFGLGDDVNLYLVPQSLFKIHPDNDALFARVLEADPHGRLVVFAAHYDAINTAFHRRLSAAFAPLGLNVDERVVFLPYMTHEEYLRVNGWCDVMLDTLHWSGGNTSLDAIASGLPLVTMPGRFMRGRQSAAMLRLAGVDELVVADEQAYAATAVAIAGDRARRDDLSRRIKSGRGALFSRDEPIRALEDFLARATE